MAFYRCARFLIDSVNNLELPQGIYVSTECEAWVKRFGHDLTPVAAVPTGGYIVRELTNLKESILFAESESVAEVVSEVVSEVVAGGDEPVVETSVDTDLNTSSVTPKLSKRKVPSSK